MSVLRIGAVGREVGAWQAFLRARCCLDGPVDGVFGAQTWRATARFQASRRLVVDGVVGPATRRAAIALGFGDADTGAPPPASAPRIASPAPQAGQVSTLLSTSVSSGDDFFPPKPSFSPIAGNAGRERAFGKFEYRAAPSASNPEAIAITDGWDHENLVTVNVPGLAGIPLGTSSAVSRGRMTFHRRAADQLVALWRAWEQAGLLGRIVSFDGAFVARFQRNSHTALSNHAFGSAFDINASWNPLGCRPASAGKGCVLALVAIANEHGFYWGGHFASRADGMHFEVAQLR